MDHAPEAPPPPTPAELDPAAALRRAALLWIAAQLVLTIAAIINQLFFPFPHTRWLEPLIFSAGPNFMSSGFSLFTLLCAAAWAYACWLLGSASQGATLTLTTIVRWTPLLLLIVSESINQILRVIWGTVPPLFVGYTFAGIQLLLNLPIALHLRTLFRDRADHTLSTLTDILLYVIIFNIAISLLMEFGPQPVTSPFVIIGYQASFPLRALA
ncbi:MAG TPA: hypothetical protein VF669_20410 [Tepidisphaeraceae bacterium]